MLIVHPTPFQRIFPTASPYAYIIEEIIVFFALCFKLSRERIHNFRNTLRAVEAAVDLTDQQVGGHCDQWARTMAMATPYESQALDARGLTNPVVPPDRLN